MDYGISGIRLSELEYTKKRIVELDHRSVDLMEDGTKSQIYLLGTTENGEEIKELTLVIELRPEQEKLYYKIPIQNPTEGYLHIEDFNRNGKKDIGVWVGGQNQNYYLYFNQGEFFRLGWSSEGLSHPISVPIRENQEGVTDLDWRVWEYVKGVYPDFNWADIDISPCHYLENREQTLIFRRNILGNNEPYKLGEIETTISFEDDYVSTCHKIINK